MVLFSFFPCRLLFGFGRCAVKTIAGELQKVRTEAQEYAEKLKRSTRMWDLVINALPVHIFAKDPADDYRFVFSNRGMQDFIRLGDEEIRGKNDFDIYPEEIAAVMRGDDEKNMLDLEHGVENVIPLPDAGGNVHPMRMITWPFVETDGSCLLIGAAFDVTELEQAKHKAEESAEWFRLTLNSIGDGVITTDRAGRVTMMNPVAERMLGVTGKEAMGLPHDQIFRIYNYDNDQPSPSPVMRTLRTGVIVELANHTDLIARDGTRYHIADSAAPIFGPDGKILGAILAFRDVTEEYAQRDRLRYAHAQLEAGTKISRSATFVFNPATGEIAGSSMLSELLPVTGGRIGAIDGWVYGEDRPAMLAKWERLARGEISSETFDYRTKDEHGFHYFRLNSSVDRSDPKQVMFTGVVQDVTDIRRVFDRLQEQRNLWEKVINSIPLCFFAKDADDDFRYVLCNRTFAAFVGRTPEEVVGRSDAELFCRPEDAEMFRSRDERIMKEPEGEGFEEAVMDFRENLHYLQTVKKPFAGADGRRLLLGASSDITDLRQLLSCEKLNSEVLSAMAANDDPDAMFENMAGILMKRMECDRIMLACCDRKGLLRLRNEWLSPGTVSIRETGLEKHYELWDRNIQAFHENRILKTSDVTQAEFCPGLNRDDKYRTISLIVVPVFVDEQLWGALFVSYSRVRREFNDVDERIMRGCASVISAALVAERQRHAIRQANHERQLVLDNIHIPIWLHDNRGELIRANTAVGDLFGIPAAELTTEKNRELLAPAFPPGTVQPIEESLKTGRAVHREMRLPGRDYIISAEPVFDSFGHLTYIVKSAIDMTEFNELLSSRTALNTCLETLIGEPELEKALEKVLQTLCAHLGASRACIFRFDEDAHTMSAQVEYVENRGDTIFGDAGGQPCSAFPDWPDRFRTEQTIVIDDASRAEAEECGWLRERKIGLADMGSICAARLIVHKHIWGCLGLIYERRPRLPEEEALQLLQSSAHFIEIMLQRRQSQDQLVDAMRKAQAADKAKSFFIAGVSHEIRTPLNAVIGFSDLLRDGGIPEAEAREYLDSISYSGNALLQLINDVLDLSKLEADQMKIEPAPIDFRELGEEVMKVFQYRAGEQQIELRVEMPPLPEMELDKLRVRQVLFNLIGNAVKFTCEGSVTLKAEYQPDHDGTCEFTFLVIDTGPGIAPEDQARLMEPFVQLSRIRGAAAGNSGTGLGLTISRRLIEKMGGTLWLKSEPGRGSVFGATLRHIRISKERKPAGPPEEKAPACGRASALSILIVDDVAMNLKVMKALCRKAGIEKIETALSGKEALALLEAHSFDLVLTDMWMPEMNGAALAGKIRADRRFQEMPILAVTADVEARDNFPLEFFNGVLLKPVTLEKIRKMLGSVQGMGV